MKVFGCIIPFPCETSCVVALPRVAAVCLGVAVHLIDVKAICLSTNLHCRSGNHRFFQVLSSQVEKCGRGVSVW